MAHTPPEKREEAIFDIVNQLNRGAALITAQDEREQLAELNLIAGKRAKASTAYASALNYFVAGAALLPEDCWERRHELTFELELHRAECEFLTGELADAEQRLASLSTRAANTVERAHRRVLARRSVHDPRSERSRRRGRSRLPPASGHRLVAAPDRRGGAARIRADLVATREPHDRGTHRSAADDRPGIARDDGCSDQARAASLVHGCEPAARLIICRAVNLSLERGNSDGSCFAYVMLGMVAGARFGDYQAAFRFGRLGYDLIEQRGLKRFPGQDLYAVSERHVLPGRDMSELAATCCAARSRRRTRSATSLSRRIAAST